MRRLLLATVVLVSMLAAAASLAGAAGAQTTGVIDEAVAALRTGDPVFVHPDAEHPIDEKVRADLRRRIERGERAVFVAVLPAAAVREAGRTPDDVVRVLYRRLGYVGTYAVVAGGSFRAASTDLPRGRAKSLADDAFRDRRDDGVGAVLVEFVDRVQHDGPEGTNWLPIVLAGLIGVVLAALVLYLVRRGRQEDAVSRRAQQLESARQAVRREVAVLAGDLLALEPTVAGHSELRDEYDAAVRRYWHAAAAVEQAASADEVASVGRVVAEARYARARVDAMAQGEQPPPPPPELAEPGPNDEPAVVVVDGVPGYPDRPHAWFGGAWFEAVETPDKSEVSKN